MTNKLKIKEISSFQLTRVINIHAQALSDDVLPNLGKKILQSFYESTIHDESQRLFGAFLSDELLGFFLISKSSAGIGKIILSRKGAIEVIKLMIFKPKIFYIGLMQAFRKLNVVDDSAEISFIAVSPNYQGQGIGKKMLIYANQWCFERGILFLQTKTANQSLREFYIKNFFAEELVQYRLLGRNYSELKWSTAWGQVGCTND